MDGENGNYSVEQLLGFYSEGIEKADYNSFMKILPASISRYQAGALYGGESSFKEECAYIHEEYGYDLKITFNITNRKEESQEWLEENQQYLRRELGINAQLTKAYLLEGTMTMSGSRKTETREIEELWYCEIDGTWGLIAG